MMMKNFLEKIIFLLVSFFFISTANAVTVAWTDWTSSAGSAITSSGELSVGSETVDVTFQSTGHVLYTGPTNYWTEYTPAPYTSGVVDNAPPPADIIQLNSGGIKTITFSQAIVDPYLALVSWNGNTVDFGDNVFNIISQGSGYWGSGTIVPNSDNTGFYGSGEVHGIIQFEGAFTSLSFIDSSENWHGLTVGVGGLSDPAVVPVPAAVWLFGSAIAGFAGFSRFKKKS